MTIRHWLTAIVVPIALAGCGTSKPTQKSASELQAEIAAALAKLPAEDRTLAETQKFCPITGEPLGSMGVPPKLAVKGKAVFICCLACKGDVEADPEKALKTIDAARAEGK